MGNDISSILPSVPLLLKEQCDRGDWVGAMPIKFYLNYYGNKYPHARTSVKGDLVVTLYTLPTEDPWGDASIRGYQPRVDDLVFYDNGDGFLGEYIVTKTDDNKSTLDDVRSPAEVIAFNDELWTGNELDYMSKYAPTPLTPHQTVYAQNVRGIWVAARILQYHPRDEQYCVQDDNGDILKVSCVVDSMKRMTLTGLYTTTTPDRHGREQQITRETMTSHISNDEIVISQLAMDKEGCDEGHAMLVISDAETKATYIFDPHGCPDMDALGDPTSDYSRVVVAVRDIFPENRREPEFLDLPFQRIYEHLHDSGKWYPHVGFCAIWSALVAETIIKNVDNDLNDTLLCLGGLVDAFKLEIDAQQQEDLNNYLSVYSRFIVCLSEEKVATAVNWVTPQYRYGDVDPTAHLTYVNAVPKQRSRNEARARFLARRIRETKKRPVETHFTRDRVIGRKV